MIIHKGLVKLIIEGSIEEWEKGPNIEEYQIMEGLQGCDSYINNWKGKCTTKTNNMAKGWKPIYGLITTYGERDFWNT